MTTKKYSVEANGSSIVVAGTFAPQSLSPDWLCARGLIGEGDVDAANQEQIVVSNQLTTFQTQWFTLQVLPQQLVINSREAVTPALMDLSVGILSLLPSTPVLGIGINNHAHFKISKTADYHKLGDKLVPKGVWYELYSPQEFNAGTIHVTVRIEPGARPDHLVNELHADYKNITIQPSANVLQGIFVMVNDHKSSMFANVEPADTAPIAAKIIADNWQSSYDKASSDMEQLIVNLIQD